MSSVISWTTPAGTIGTYPATIAMTFKIQATATTPYTIVEYILLSGNLPNGLSFRADGLISGSPDTVSFDTVSTFVVRARASNGTSVQIQDRTFNITITGAAIPTFTTASGSILTANDSTWVELPIEYNNPISTNPIFIRVLTGSLPPGLEINEFGLIRGYPIAPVSSVNKPAINTIATATNSTDNTITVLSTEGFAVNRPVTFTGNIIGTTGATLTAGSFIPGQQYKILTLGTTDFTSIGATSNTVGTVFKATGAGIGTGTAQILITPITLGTIYYIKSFSGNSFTITDIIGGDTISLNSAIGAMTVNLSAISLNDPTKEKYTFTLELLSPKGNDSATYSIIIINQELPISQGGLGKLPNQRAPTIYNTRPPTFNIESNPTDFGYYVLPPIGSVSPFGVTYLPNQPAYIGQFESGNFFSFHILGHDFEGVTLTYVYNSLPTWATGNLSTGWIYGVPNIPVNTVVEYTFYVAVAKTVDTTIYYSQTFTYTFRVANTISGQITWITDSDLGIFYNASPCYQNIVAESDVPLKYSITSGNLPNTLTFTEEGELIGTIVYQPGTNYISELETNTYTFTVKAESTDVTLANVIQSSKTFTMVISQEFTVPTDNLYIKCTPNVSDRQILNSLLSDDSIIPSTYLFRPNDENFGKAKDVTYAHAYGINSSGLSEYLEAVQKNHYWRDITLGQLKTAIARDKNNNILYEVVYSTVIDNLQYYDPAYNYDYRYSTSISETIVWPRFIDLNLGPWYSSSTEIYTSYIFNTDAYIITNFTEYNLLTQTGLPILLQQGVPTFYTSLTPGYAKILYPNSLENMRKRVEQDLGAVNNSKILPLWMSSQQLDGNTLGFTPAWVIAYTKPVETVITTATQTFGTTNRILANSTNGFIVGRPIIFTGNMIGNINPNQVYYVKEIVSPTLFTISASITTNSLNNPVPGPEVTLYSESTSITETPNVPMTVTFDPVSYAEIIKQNIQTEWAYQLNDIDFNIDRFSVDKVLTYDWDTYLLTPTWTEYPTSTPKPEPEQDSKNFYVIFPRKTILPDKDQSGA